MDADSCAELISAVALAPLCYPNLRTPIDSVVTASDASESGAGVVRSVCLSPVGLQMVASFEREGIALASEHWAWLPSSTELVALGERWRFWAQRQRARIVPRLTRPACASWTRLGPAFDTWATCARSRVAHGGR